MKKFVSSILILLMCALVFSGCACEHEWAEATCTEPKTCTLCEETEGEALGHVWMAATCEKAKTCETCGTTEGTAKGHSWVDATCTEAKTCSACKKTEGEALGHNWQDATTENPKTCQTCKLTEGTKINTDPRFTTAENSFLFGTWSSNVKLPGAALGYGLEAYVDELECFCQFEFRNDGTGFMQVKIVDEAAYLNIMRQYTIDLMYAEFAGMGMNATQAQAAMKQNYGMTIEEYVDAEMKNIDMDDLYEDMNEDYVYYVKDGKLYMGDDWDEQMEPEEYKLEGDKLILPDEEFGEMVLFKS